MKKRHIACLATLALISACGRGDDKATANKTKDQQVQDAVNVASEPFSIGDEAEDQMMGTPPANPMAGNPPAETNSQ